MLSSVLLKIVLIVALEEVNSIEQVNNYNILQPMVRGSVAVEGKVVLIVTMYLPTFCWNLVYVIFLVSQGFYYVMGSFFKSMRWWSTNFYLWASHIVFNSRNIHNYLAQETNGCEFKSTIGTVFYHKTHEISILKKRKKKEKD